MDIRDALKQARNYYMEAQGAVLEATRWLWCGWNIGADWVERHKHWALVIIITAGWLVLRSLAR